MAAQADLTSIDHIRHDQGTKPLILSDLGNRCDEFSQRWHLVSIEVGAVSFHGCWNIAADVPGQRRGFTLGRSMLRPYRDHGCRTRRFVRRSKPVILTRVRQGPPLPNYP